MLIDYLTKQLVMLKYIAVVFLMILFTSLQGTNSPEYFAELNKVVVLDKSFVKAHHDLPDQYFLLISDGKTANLIECNPLYYDKVNAMDTLRTVLVKN